MALFYRWVPKNALDPIKEGLVSHHASAMWIFRLGRQYHQPRSGISAHRMLIAYELDDLATANLDIGTIDFESADFRGEKAHPRFNIVKRNEPGVYGLGKMRQLITNQHATTRYASLDEVAAALGKNRLEVSDDYKPATGWGVVSK